MKNTDITGKKFGKLTAIRLDHKGKNKSLQSVQYWLFKCDCGKEKIIKKQNVLNGNTKSCGCIHRDSLIKRNKKHGLSYTRLYVVYAGMKARCYDKKHISYKYYGERGISVCDEWKNDFNSFHEWSIKNGYDENAKKGECTIDRIDVNGNYCPENCRWINIEKQNRNHRNNKKITINGKTLCMTEWEDVLGFPVGTIRRRTNLGWPIERIISTPIINNKQRRVTWKLSHCQK